MNGWNARGVSLVGLLMIVVVLGAMTATAVIGVSSLTGSGGGGADAGKAATAIAGGAKVAPGGISAGASSACRAAADAARASSTIYFANRGGTFPASWSDLTTGNPAVYALPELVVINGGNPKELDGRGWKLLMTGGGAARPAFTCS